MKARQKLRRAGEVLLILLIVALSVGIFLYRDRIGQVSRVGYLGLMGLCFLANATVFLPAPSLLIAASCALIMDPLLVALCAAFGSALGEMVGYLLGVVMIVASPGAWSISLGSGAAAPGSIRCASFWPALRASF